MQHEVVIQQTAAHIQKASSGDTSGHDWWHVHRVWQLARRIADSESADRFIVELAALLHDIADWKFHGGDESAGPRAARAWLMSLGVEDSTIDAVCEIIAKLSFKGAGVPTPMPTMEGQIVQDADRLDALGAIGIARTFAFGGYRGQPMFDPSVPPQMHASFEAYKQNKGTSVNHFFEKLLLLKDRMNTETARQIAAERHQFMEQFLSEFFTEWGVPDWPTYSSVGLPQAVPHSPA